MKNIFTIIILSLYFFTASLAYSEPAKIIAHRASSGLWIQNSSHAVTKTIELFSQSPHLFHGIEVDIVLTKDLVPVLSHDPWVHKNLCQRTDGKALKEELIKDITWKELQKNYRCGDIQDPEFPDSKTLNQTNSQNKSGRIMSLDDFFTVVEKHPQLIIYLDNKIDSGLTANANEYAKAIDALLQKHRTTNPLYIEGPSQDALNAYQLHIQRNFVAVLSYPAFFAHENWWLKGAYHAIASFFFPSRAQQLARNADAIATHTAILNPRMEEKLLAANKDIIVFTPNTQQEMDNACQTGAQLIITDYPTLRGCEEQPLQSKE